MHALQKSVVSETCLPCSEPMSTIPKTWILLLETIASTQVAINYIDLAHASQLASQLAIACSESYLAIAIATYRRYFLLANQLDIPNYIYQFSFNKTAKFMALIFSHVACQLGMQLQVTRQLMHNSVILQQFLHVVIAIQLAS